MNKQRRCFGTPINKGILWLLPHKNSLYSIHYCYSTKLYLQITIFALYRYEVAMQKKKITLRCLHYTVISMQNVLCVSRVQTLRLKTSTFCIHYFLILLMFTHTFEFSENSVLHAVKFQFCEIYPAIQCRNE